MLKVVNAFIKEHRKELDLKGTSKMTYLQKIKYLEGKVKGTKYEREIGKLTKPRVDEGIKKVLMRPTKNAPEGRGQNVREKKDKDKIKKERGEKAIKDLRKRVKERIPAKRLADGSIVADNDRIAFNQARAGLAAMVSARTPAQRLADGSIVPKKPAPQQKGDGRSRAGLAKRNEKNLTEAQKDKIKSKIETSEKTDEKLSKLKKGDKVRFRYYGKVYDGVVDITPKIKVAGRLKNVEIRADGMKTPTKLIPGKHIL